MHLPLWHRVRLTGTIKPQISKSLMIGLLLLLPSLYTLLLMARELYVESVTDRRYTVSDCFESRPGQDERSQMPMVYVWQGQKVVFSDDYTKGHYEADARRAGKVKITINNKIYTSPWPVEVRPTDFNSNRYWMQVMLVKMTDNNLHNERLVVLQSYPDYNLNEHFLFNVDALTCRALFIDPQGRVTEKVFPFSERASPPYRTLLARQVAPMELGFYSQVFTFLPSLIYPLLYPLVSGITGTALTIIGLVKYHKRKAGIVGL